MLHRLQGNRGVIRLLECFEDDDSVQIVTELCPGGDLHKFVEVRRRRGSNGVGERRGRGRAGCAVLAEPMHGGFCTFTQPLRMQATRTAKLRRKPGSGY
eukprot:355797-Chlamydomonas_euryale.AAC.7